MTKFRIDLSLAARAKLIQFVADNAILGKFALTTAEAYADAWLEGYDQWSESGAEVFELRASDTKSGRPETISFSNDEDFVCVEEEGE